MKSSALKAVAKAGYASRGVIYVTIGGLATLAALGSGGGTEGSKGALLTLLESGFGTLLLVVIALGLFCYAFWRALQSLADADDHGTDARGLVVRGGLGVSAVTHTLLGLWALSIVFGLSGGGSDNSGGGGQGFAAWLMKQPFGPWLVAAAGLSIVGAGIAHIVKGVGAKFEKWLDASEREMTFIRPVCMIGLIARGIVFLIVGGFFIYAGVSVDPQEAGGLPQALEWIRSLPLGQIIFLVIAVGLLAFGGYSLLEAVYRRVEDDSAGSTSKARQAAA